MRTTAAVLAVLLFGCGDNNVPGTPGTEPTPSPDPYDVPPMQHPGDIPFVPPDGGLPPDGGGGGGSGSDAGMTCLAAPNLRFVGSTATSVTLEVCAGDTGLPAGFSVLWSTVCGAGFGEEHFDSRFALAAQACTNVTIGRLFDEDPGVAYTCDELACGTEYAFQAYGNPTAILCASDPSCDVRGSTLACEPVNDGCTLTQGYWKNHDGWPVTELAIGARTYSAAELLAAFKTPARGNGLVILEHQLAAARLNIANGANPAAVVDTLTAADALIGSAVVPPIGDGYLAPAVASPLADTLASFNEGKIGPGHCDF